MGFLDTLADILTREPKKRPEFGPMSDALAAQSAGYGVTGGLLNAVDPYILNPMASPEHQYVRNTEAALRAGKKPAAMSREAMERVGLAVLSSGPVAKSGVPGYVEDAATREANFKKWFGDSKVVDAEGKPLTVYHGAPDTRGIYKDGFSTLGERYNNLDNNGPYFFSNKREVANSYADDRRAFDYQGAEPGVISANVKMENPLTVNVRGANFRGVSKKHILESIEDGPMRDNLARELERINPGRENLTTDMLGGVARRYGYDGVVVKNVKDNYAGKGPNSDVYMVFGNKNIKSTSNRGTYDPTDPNILKSLIPAAATAYGIDQVLPYD